MNERDRQRLVDGYLRRLARELDDAPREARQELLEDVRGHIEEAWAASGQTEADLQAILRRLGEPAALAAEEREKLGLPAPARSPDLLAVAAIVLTALFWPLGLLLAWLSARWRVRDKAIATLMPPLGLALVLSVSLAANSTGPVVSGPAEVVGGPGLVGLWFGEALALLGLFAPLAAAVFLAWRLRPRPGWSWLLAIAGTGALVCLLILVFFLQALPNGGRPATGPAPVRTAEVITNP